MNAVTQITTWPATTVPTDPTLTGKVIERRPRVKSIDLMIIGGTPGNIYTLIEFKLGDAQRWAPISDLTLVSDYGSTSFMRLSPGDRTSHFACYRKSGAGTPTAIYIGENTR